MIPKTKVLVLLPLLAASTVVFAQQVGVDGEANESPEIASIGDGARRGSTSAAGV